MRGDDKMKDPGNEVVQENETWDAGMDSRERQNQGLTRKQEWFLFVISSSAP